MKSKVIEAQDLSGVSRATRVRSAKGLIAGSLGACTQVTRIDIVPDFVLHTRPPEETGSPVVNLKVAKIVYQQCHSRDGALLARDTPMERICAQ